MCYNSFSDKTDLFCWWSSNAHKRNVNRVCLYTGTIFFYILWTYDMPLFLWINIIPGDNKQNNAYRHLTFENIGEKEDIELSFVIHAWQEYNQGIIRDRDICHWTIFILFWLVYYNHPMSLINMLWLWNA